MYVDKLINIATLISLKENPYDTKISTGCI